MKNLKYFFIYFVFSFFMQGCRKYPPPSQALVDPPELCEYIAGFNPVSNNKFIIVAQNKFYHAKAKFNPSNDQQIFYLEYEKNIPGQLVHYPRLMSYNLLSGYTYAVWESMPRNIHPVVKNYAPGPTGAILIESTTGEIYSISINGGQPTKLIKKPAKGGLLSNPSWNRDGSKIMVSVNGPFGKYNVIFDHKGIPLDTIFNLTNGTFSNNSSLLTSIDNSGIVRQFNPDFDKTVRSYQTPFKNNTGLNVAISPNGFEMIVCDYDYIYQVNLIDSSTKSIRQICETKQYGMPSYSFKGDKILFTKECYRRVNQDSLAFSSSIHVMDKNCFHQDSIPLRTF